MKVVGWRFLPAEAARAALFAYAFQIRQGVTASVPEVQRGRVRESAEEAGVVRQVGTGCEESAQRVQCRFIYGNAVRRPNVRPAASVREPR